MVTNLCIATCTALVLGNTFLIFLGFGLITESFTFLQILFIILSTQCVICSGEFENWVISSRKQTVIN